MKKGYYPLFAIFIDNRPVGLHECQESALMDYRSLKDEYPDKSITVFSIWEITDNPHFLHCLDDYESKK